ncbi:MAG: PKD domain-containing protein [Methanomassiliicoccales archaeon]|nr:PKD domain-containing protein [Methanomassiliicoccales archaeon]
MKARKIATGMLVAVLLLSSLAVVMPATTVQAAGASSAQISFNVVDTSSIPVAGATATITETHTSTTITNTSNTAGLVTFSPLPGYYILTITKNGYYTLQYSAVVKFTGVDSVSLGPIQITALPPASGSLTVTVTPGSASVTMKLIDYNSNPKMTVNATTFSGSTTVHPYQSTYHVVLTSTGYEAEVRSVVVGAAPVTLTVSLNTSVTLSGFVYKAGAAPSGVSAVLVSTDTTKPLEKRIVLPRTLSSNYFLFDAYPGSFILLVDATDSMAYMNTTVTILPSTPASVNVNLAAQSGQRDTSHVSFASSDWNAFTLTRVMNMNFDASWANIPYSYIPNLRMQIDFAFGDGNGQVSSSEFTAFVNRVTAFGPQNVTSDFIVRVNGTKFMNSADFTQVSFSNISGTSVTSTTGYIAGLKTPYQSMATITNGYSTYTALGYARYDTPSVDYKETLKWPSAYEMTSNTTQTSFVKVSGYLNVTIDTTIRTSGTGTYEQVTMGIQKSVAPKAVGAVTVPSTYAYAVTNSTGAVLYYIVSTDRAIIYTGNGSSDPNGNPLKYTWNFVGVGTIGPMSSPWTPFTISAASFNITVVLTVTDVAGLTNQTSFYIKADGIVPVADFSIRNHTVSAGTLTVDQNEALVFNGASSFDHIASTSDVGIIKTYVYTWGDGNKTTVSVGENQNVTKTYARPGTFGMSLNVTDAAGHYSIKSIVVVVRDKTPPVVSFTITKPGSPSTPISTAQENQTLVFNGNATFDPYVPFAQLNFTWDFGDGVVKYGNYQTHFFQAIKTFTVKLTVKNPTNNSANTTKSLTITSQPRPDLRVVSIVFSPSVMTEGEQGTITVNITNVGNDVAGAPMVAFYILQSSGTKTPIGNSSNLKINGTTPVPSELKPGQYGVITLSWTPSSKGNYTIFVNAVTNGEINKADNTDQAPVTVNEAAWKAVALYGGIFAVIIVVIVLFYMRRRLPKLPKLGGKGKTEEKKPTGKK